MNFEKKKLLWDEKEKQEIVVVIIIAAKSGGEWQRPAAGEWCLAMQIPSQLLILILILILGKKGNFVTH